MEKTVTKTGNISQIIVHVMYDDGKTEIVTFTKQSLKRFQKSKKWKRVLSATKLQEQEVTVRAKLYPEGINLKKKNNV